MFHFAWIGAAAGLLFAEAGSLPGTLPVAGNVGLPPQAVDPTIACAHEIAEMRGVWRSPGAFLPLYIDWNMMGYLATLGAQAAGTGRPTIAVLPVYSAEPAHFRVANFIFLTTAFLAEAKGEPDLLDAIQAELARKQKKMPAWVSACTAMPPGDELSFPERQQRLAEGVGVYTEMYTKWTTPRLKRRAGNRQTTVKPPSAGDPSTPAQ